MLAFLLRYSNKCTKSVLVKTTIALKTQVLTLNPRQRQVSKFAFVQDRLREWRPDVLSKIEHFSCMTLAMLDIDGYRIDKGLTITIDAQAHWSKSIRACAKRFGKENFYISGE